MKDRTHGAFKSPLFFIIAGAIFLFIALIDSRNSEWNNTWDVMHFHGKMSVVMFCVCLIALFVPFIVKLFKTK